MLSGTVVVACYTVRVPTVLLPSFTSRIFYYSVLFTSYAVWRLLASVCILAFLSWRIIYSLLQPAADCFITFPSLSTSRHEYSRYKRDAINTCLRPSVLPTVLPSSTKATPSRIKWLRYEQESFLFWRDNLR